jgi:hypothetical protein
MIDGEGHIVHIGKSTLFIALFDAWPDIDLDFGFLFDIGPGVRFFPQLSTPADQ